MEVIWFYLMIIVGVLLVIASMWNIFVLRKQRRYEVQGDLGEEIVSFPASRSNKVWAIGVGVVFIVLIFIVIRNVNNSRETLQRITDEEIRMLLEEAIRMNIGVGVLLVGIIFLYATKVVRVFKSVSIYTKGIINRGVFYSFHAIEDIVGDAYSVHLHLPKARLKKRIPASISSKDAKFFLEEAKEAKQAFEKKKKNR